MLVMVLSIGMIVKNEEKYLRQCLESLQPIRDALECELIIVDTGSTDSTVEIAKEFTDNVLFFEWINDFAAARNVSLKASKGEWYMYVDGDEVFKACDDIINFFKSGEYKEYGSAFYTIRSYSDIKNKTGYADCFVPRLSKRTDELEFEGIIHEKLTPKVFPRRILTDVADHYGYVFNKNDDLKDEKFERNSRLLLEQLKENGDELNPVLYRELFDTFNFLDDKTQALEYAYKGIEQAKEMKNDYVLGIYHSIALLYHCKQESEKVLEVYDEYFEVEDEIRQKERSLDVEFYGFKAAALFRLERYEEAYTEFRKYFTLDNKFTSQGICTREALYVQRYYTSEYAVLDFNMLYAETCLRLKRYKEAEESFRKYSLNKFEFSHTLKIMRLNQMIDYLRYTGAKAFSAMYNSLDDNNRGMLFNATRFRLFAWEPEEQRSMLNKFVAMNFSDPEYNALSHIQKAHLLDGGAGAQRITDFIENHSIIYPDVMYIALKENLDIAPYMEESVNIGEIIRAGFNNIVSFCDALKKYDTAPYVCDENLLSLIRLYTQAVVSAAETGNDIQQFTALAGSLSMKYLNAFGEENIPAEVYAAVIIEQINILRGMRNFKECIACLRQLIQIDKKYAPVAKVYQNLLKEDMGN